MKKLESSKSLNYLRYRKLEQIKRNSEAYKSIKIVHKALTDKMAILEFRYCQICGFWRVKTIAVTAQRRYFNGVIVKIEHFLKALYFPGLHHVLSAILDKPGTFSYLLTPFRFKKNFFGERFGPIIRASFWREEIFFHLLEMAIT